MLDNESDDMIDVTKPETTPLFQTSPERIGLAIGDGLENWCCDFHDAEGVTFFEGDATRAPVAVCIQYVREDLFNEQADEIDRLRAALSERDRMLREAVTSMMHIRAMCCGPASSRGESLDFIAIASNKILAAYDASKKENT